MLDNDSKADTTADTASQTQETMALAYQEQVTIRSEPQSPEHAIAKNEKTPLSESFLPETVITTPDEGGTSENENFETPKDASAIQSVYTETEDDFESAEEYEPSEESAKATDGVVKNRKRSNISQRSSTDATVDIRSSLSSTFERLHETDELNSGESDTSATTSVSSPTESYKPESDKENSDDSPVNEIDPRSRKVTSLPPQPTEALRVSMEGIALPSKSRKMRLDDHKKVKGFAKHFSFPMNPFAKSPEQPVSDDTPPKRPSELYQKRMKKMSSDKQRARESITSIVSLRDMLALKGRTSEEQHSIVFGELEKLKHEIDGLFLTRQLADFWASVLVDYEKINKSNSKLLSEHIQLGIPSSLRGMMWQLFSGSKDEELEERYRELLDETSSHEKLILRDLARTFPGHQYFKERGGAGQEGLFNVVKAYSLYDPEVGYCQGLAFVVGPLLLNMPDEEAFCVLVQLMKKYGLRGHFTPQMEQLHCRLYQFEQLLLDKLPHIYRYLHEQGIRSTMYASQWFMTLFAYKFPLDLVFRIFDIILAEGIDCIFKFALANDDRRLVYDACSISLNQKKLKQYAKQHDVLMVKEQQMFDKQETLRQSNRELMETVQRLEKSIMKLQQDHEEVASQVITSKIDLARMDSENSELRNQNSILRRQLDELPAEIEGKWTVQFDTLCEKNAGLVQKNSALEDKLTAQEGILIDFKMKYAESENDNESLLKQLNQLKKITSSD
ncbi:hypothetical protein INT43_003486 [Umbelopsis isabellina]|uniref:Rab-GAP TBC domain-containing protein n=1 Tax=Mortierella isabellina TaxID=91625 RepID=A0A8H7PQC0_MORIS|nr:hypothetical protein INT43_003486 [Umbelopsis isabellina]